MKKILVLDDDYEILYVVSYVLRGYDYIIKTTPKWTVITDIIKSFSPDLILMDIDLNGADGSEICKNLKKLKENETLPIILFSAYTVSKKYIINSNAQGFLKKPFTPTELVEIVSLNLRKSQPSQKAKAGV